MTSQPIKPINKAPANTLKSAKPNDGKLVHLSEMDTETLDAFIRHLHSKVVDERGFEQAPALKNPADKAGKIKLIEELREFAFQLKLPKEKPAASPAQAEEKSFVQQPKSENKKEQSQLAGAIEESVAKEKTPSLKVAGANQPARRKPRPVNKDVLNTNKTSANPLKNRPLFEDDDDEGVEDGKFFNLSDYFLKPPIQVDEKFKRELQLEVGIFEKGQLVEVHHVNDAHPVKVKSGWRNLIIAKSDKGRLLVQAPNENFNATLRKGTQSKPLPTKEFVQLKPGLWLDMAHADQRFLIRPMPAVISPSYQAEQSNARALIKKFGTGSAVFHFVLLIIMAIVSWSTHDPVEEIVEPEFIELDVSKLIEPPKPKPKPKPVEPVKAEPKPQPKPQPTPKPVEKTPPKPAAKPVPKAAPSPEPKAKSVAQSGLLASLPSTKKSSANALALASNLDAVKSSDASNARVSVSGLTASVDGVKTSLSSGQMLNTKGGAQALAGGGAAGVLVQGTAGGGAIQGAVTAGSYSQTKVSGGITRAQVKSVIDAHMNEVTYCYETALASNPNLGGKIVFEWGISTSGSVTNVGVTSSTVKSNSLHNCIKQRIASWTFPQPKGSEVQVSYPFVFNMVGY